MKAAMDSPDRNPFVPSSDFQGSPFFHFLCGLSPIKAVRSGYGTQTYSELSFPPPPAVFVSPKAEPRTVSAPPKRKVLVQLAHDNEQEKNEECDVGGTERGSSPLPRGSNKDKASQSSRNDLERWSIGLDSLSMDATSGKHDPAACSNLDFPQVNTESSNLHRNEELTGECEQQRGCIGATTVGSVGLRRCLDFEDYAMTQKALDNLPMSRIIGISSDNPTRIGFPTTSTPFSGHHRIKHPGVEYLSSSSKIWDNSMLRCHNMGDVPPPPYAKIPNSGQISQYNTSTLAPQCENPLSFRVDMANTTLQASDLEHHRLPGMENVKVDGGQGGRFYNQEELSSAHVGLHLPIAFHQPLALGCINSAELENISAALIEKVALLQESSHQSESDHLEDSTSSHRSPRKKRKFSTQTGHNGGESCKNCKCKKSKCLKLYCECFAAGVYCIDICNCHDCYNKPEYEETVLGTRQQIESRNPLAFIPRIIRALESSPTIGEEGNEIPASARHKRGCNCKKSQCLKKYCECYQAGVGCADGCRCEGCRNIYGRNEVSGDLEDKEQQADALHAKSTIMDARNDTTESRVTPQQLNEQNSTDLTPITPYLDYSGLCRSDLGLGLTKRSTSPFGHPISSVTFQSQSKLLELLEETEDYGRANMQPHEQATCANAVRDTSLVAQNEWNTQATLYAPSPTSQPLQQLTQAVADALLIRGDSHNNYDQSLSHITNYMPGMKKQETNQPSFIQQVVPLDFPPSENTIAIIPVTPLLPSTTTYSTRPSFVDMSESPGLHQSGWLTDEDDGSPNVFKELSTFCAPEVVMKTRSPQQKRIFSYQHNAKDMNSKSSTTAPGMASWSGRKFILH